MYLTSIAPKPRLPRMKILASMLALGLVLQCVVVPLHPEYKKQLTIEVSKASSVDFENFLGALSEVESNNDDSAVGDNGQAIGRFQIHKSYWIDAVEFDPSIGGSYKDVVDPTYASKVVSAYFRRYGKKYLETQDWESLARLHNGGPGIFKRKASKAWENTSKYWSKVKAALND